MATKTLIAILFLAGVSAVTAQQPAYQRVESVRGEVNGSQQPVAPSGQSAPEPVAGNPNQSLQQPANPSGESAPQPVNSSGQPATQPVPTRPTGVADVSRQVRRAPPTTSSGNLPGLQQQKSLGDIARERRVTTPVNPTKVSTMSGSRKKGTSHHKRASKTVAKT